MSIDNAAQAFEAQSNHGLVRRGGAQPLENFLEALGLPHDFTKREEVQGPEYEKARRFLIKDRPMRQNHWPALALGILSQAELLLATEGLTSVDDVFSQFELERSAPNKVVNTLNLVSSGTTYTLRPRFNWAASVIRVEMRRQHPSAAAHATQSWRSYLPFISAVYRASPSERLAVARLVWDLGVLQAPERRFATSAVRIVRPFEHVLANMPTQGFTPGGALFQSLVFGFFRADSPNLTLESHSVNTGSSRADMPGDVAGFRGGEVELAVEVKDHNVTEDTVTDVLGDFLEDLVGAPNATAVVVANEVTHEAREVLAVSNVIALSREDLRSRVMTWDLPKQQEALRGANYYLARIQKNEVLRSVFQKFLEESNLEVDQNPQNLPG